MRKFINAIMKWLGSAKILSVPRGYVGKVLVYYYLAKNGVLFFYDDPASTQVFNLIKQIKKETEMILKDHEAYQIYRTVRETEKIKGDIAEVGVYKGGSAKLICEATKKPVHLFDTFEGLPDLCEIDNPEQFRKGDYSAQFENVKSYLKKYPDVYFYKGLFPSTSELVKNKKFSFVHLDVDLYESTLNCLKFFYPKINRGGVIISHDYLKSEGVKRAFDKFFKDKPEIIIELPACDQCLVVKL
ncbi:macrocin-O-methyltransferase [Patescibacteria group bacterium]|nr:MAG: macrocin-O-methyltransferase [Patescibacteria group bacterium]